MENEEIISSSTREMEKEILREKTEVPLQSNQTESNTVHQDDKNDLGPKSSQENSAVALVSTSASSKTIKVYLRLKPFPSEVELTKEQEDAYTIVDSTTLLTKFPGLDVNTRSLKNLKSSERVCRTFTFTTTFGPGISQTEFFCEAIEPQIDNFLAGQSSTIMSYGTSNAGKSYTLYGVSSALGIIPLSMNLIFCKVKSTLSTPWYKPIHQNHVIGLSSTDRSRELEIRDKLLSFESPEKVEFMNAYEAMQETIREEEGDFASRRDDHVLYSVWISFAEIYNDAIYDLLSSDWHQKRLPLKMVTDKQGRTFIKDLRTVYVNSDEEAYRILLAGQYRSRIAATTLNSRSSRSHCIFTIKLLKYYTESTAADVEVSALSFCDLAGSGRLKMTTNIRDRLKETQNINTSLLVLGRCLKSIWEGQSVRQKSEVVGPFRESKLTRLFQKALSGKEQITLIVNVNPVPSLYAETQNVLNFSAIAKKIIVEPIRDMKKKMYTSRFSRVVSQSVKTVTDWDHATGEGSTHEIYLEKVKTSDYVPRECYDDLSADHEKLKEEYAALKTSMIDKDLEIRDEMANTYTGLINNLEANWRSRSKNVEEQQEHLLAWSVSQVENFYKEKLNRLNSRKRRRWDNGDAVDDREADIREMEAENASLTTKILVTKETIKELRSARENAFAEKNKTVFELSLVKEEIIGVKKMLEAAENDIRCGKDGTHFTHELKDQLISREERIKSLKEFLNEAKEEYIRITSDAGQMQEELKEANAALIESEEKIEDLEEQLDQSNIFLAKRAKEIEQLTEKLERQSKQLAEFQERARSAEEELKESESIRLNLIGAVEDLNKLHKVACTRHASNFNYFQYSSTDSEMNIDFGRNITELEKPKIEPEDSPARQGLRANDRLENTVNLETHLERLTDTSIAMLDTDQLVYKQSQNSFKLSDSGRTNDSGIGVTIGSENQSMEQINSTVDFDPEEKNSRMSSSTTYDKNSGDKQLVNFQFEYGESTACCSLDDNILLKELIQELENPKQGMASVSDGSCTREVRAKEHRINCESIKTELRSVNGPRMERESQFADIVTRLETKIDEYAKRIDTFQKEFTTRMDTDGYCCKCSNDRVSKPEEQFPEVNVQLDQKAAKYFNEHETEVERLEKEFSVFKERCDLNFQDYTFEEDINTLSELKKKVNEFKIALTKCQTQKLSQHEELRGSLERLSSLESQIRNWSMQESEEEREISTSDGKLEEDLIAITAQVERGMCLVSSDPHRSENERNGSELCSTVTRASDEDVHKDFEGFHASEKYADDEKFENHSSYLKNEEKRMPRFRTKGSPGGAEASTTIGLLTAPTSTPRGAVSHSDAKRVLTADQGKSSNSLSGPVVLVKGRSRMTKKTSFQWATEDEIKSHSEPREANTILLAGGIMLIIFLVIVCLVQYV